MSSSDYDIENRMMVQVSWWSSDGGHAAYACWVPMLQNAGYIIIIRCRRKQIDILGLNQGGGGLRFRNLRRAFSVLPERTLLKL